MKKQIQIKASEITPSKLTELFRAIFIDLINSPDKIVLKDLNALITFNQEKVVLAEDNTTSKISFEVLDVVDEIPVNEPILYPQMKLDVDEKNSVTDDAEEIIANEDVKEQEERKNGTDLLKSDTDDKIKGNKEKKEQNSSNALQIEDIVASSENYADFLSKMSDIMHFSNSKFNRAEQFNIIIKTALNVKFRWDIIYKKMESAGLKFTISDQQYFSNLVSRYFDMKITKFLGKVAIELSKRFGTDLAGIVKKSTEKDENVELRVAEKIIKEPEAIEKNDEIQGDKGKTLNKSIVVARRIFYCLPAKEELDDEYAKKVEAFEEFVIETDKSKILLERIKSVLHFMIPEDLYKLSQIDVIAEYFGTLFWYKNIDFDIPNLFEDSVFMVKTRIRKFIYTFTKNYYGIEKVAIEPFIAELRDSIINDDEKSLLKD